LHNIHTERKGPYYRGWQKGSETGKEKEGWTTSRGGKNRTHRGGGCTKKGETLIRGSDTERKVKNERGGGKPGCKQNGGKSELDEHLHKRKKQGPRTDKNRVAKKSETHIYRLPPSGREGEIIRATLDTIDS